MATRRVSLIERSIDKVLLVSAIAFSLTLAALFAAGSPNRATYRGTPVGPRELDERILDDARALQTAVRAAQPADAAVPRYSEQLRERLMRGLIAASAADGGPALPDALRRGVDFGPAIGVPGLEGREHRDLILVTPLRPTRPAVRTGRSVVAGAATAEPGQADASRDQGRTEPGESSWVSVAAYWESQAQRDAMTAAGYAAGRTRVYVAGVDLQRQELPAGGVSDWRDVPRSQTAADIELAEPLFDDGSGAMLNREQVEQSFHVVKDSQHEIMQPRFGLVAYGDPWSVPPIEGFDKTDDEPGPPPRERPIRPVSAGIRRQIHTDLCSATAALRQRDFGAAHDLAERVFAHRSSSDAQYAAAWRIMRRADKSPTLARDEPLDGAWVTHPKAPGQLAVWVHDDGVEPGRTVRYRMRVNLWNRYAGRAGSLRDPAQARHSVLQGDWSEPSEPVSVAPATHFFLSSTTPDRNGVIVDVYRWRRGEWLKERFAVSVGDTIGGVRDVRSESLDAEGRPLRYEVDFRTGATVLDLRYDEPVEVRTAAGKQGQFTFAAQPSVVMTYLDAADGQVKQRVLATDRRDLLRRRLDGE